MIFWKLARSREGAGSAHSQIGAAGRGDQPDIVEALCRRTHVGIVAQGPGRTATLVRVLKAFRTRANIADQDLVPCRSRSAIAQPACSHASAQFVSVVKERDSRTPAWTSPFCLRDRAAPLAFVKAVGVRFNRKAKRPPEKLRLAFPVAKNRVTIPGYSVYTTLVKEQRDRLKPTHAAR